MAEQERTTKAERREARRQDRLRAEEEAKAAASRARVRNAGIAVLSVALIGGLVFLAVDNTTTDVVAGTTITQDDAEDARAAAGCEVLDVQRLEDRTHYEPVEVPPADQIYTAGRPTNSGPHYTSPNGVINGASNNQLDEYATTHNLEHGSVIVWYDPEQVDGGDVDDMDDWVSGLNAAGFANERTGAALFASPYSDPGIDSGKAVALRAWGVSMDCDAWDPVAANAFVIEHFGTNGSAPENTLGPYPSEVLGFGDTTGEVPDVDAPDEGDQGSDAPSEGAGDGADAEPDAGTMAPSPAPE